MKAKIVPTKSVVELQQVGKQLTITTPGMPRMGMLFGDAGLGKTTAVAHYVAKNNGVYVRCMASWSPSSMAKAICHELGIPPRRNTAEMMQDIIQRLGESQRPLFIDEADYIVTHKAMVESLRDLHDMADVPVVLIGMKDIQAKIKRFPQFESRIMQWVKLNPADLEDTILIAEELCEVRVQTDLVERLHQTSRGNMRRIVVGLAQIEAYARNQDLHAIGLENWGNREFFLGGR